jgi:alkanesulfonate monooxygenase SsuD/methylene tetrahydromethanopterin reductase-like flavin-dependent oxidoreductase (luciferase family)
MKVGIGLPTTTAGGGPSLLTDWSKRAEQLHFSTLAVLDRVVYRSHDPLIALAAAAAVTERIQLATMILIGPLRNTVLLAKATASLQTLSGGRLLVGLGIGARQDDYDLAGVAKGGRGMRLFEQLEKLRSLWEGSEILPDAEISPPRLFVGGGSGEAFARMARLCDGYMHGGGPPRAFASAAGKALAAWRDLGRPGKPRLMGMAYFALGPGVEQAAAEYLRHYYAFTGPFAEKVAAANLISEGMVRDFVRGYADAGCDELVLFPTVSSADQVDRLREALP